MGDPVATAAPVSTPTSRPTRVRFGVLGFMCSLAVLTYLDRICIMTVGKDIQTDLGFDEQQMGYVFAAFLLGYALFEIPGGWMGDVWGSRKVVTRIVVLWSIFTALTGAIWRFSPNTAVVLGTMIAIRFLFGCGEAGAFPNIARITLEWFPFRERGLIQGLVWMSARLGGTAAPFVIYWLTVALGWRLAFVVLGSVGAVWATAFYLWFRNSPEEMPACNDEERELICSGPEVAHTGHPSPPWRKLLRLPSVYALCLASLAVCFPWYFFATWQPLFFTEVYHVEPKNSELIAVLPFLSLSHGALLAVITGAPFLFGAAGSLAGGWVSDRLIRSTGSRRWGRSLLGIGGFSAAGGCFVVAAHMPQFWQAAALFCLASFFNDLGIPTIWAACADIGGRYSGTLSGIMNMAGGVGAVASPIVVPYLRTAFLEQPPQQRWILVLGILASGWFVGAVGWACINAGRPLEEPVSEPAA